MKNKIENSSPKISPLPGTVVAHFIRCGRINCKCAKGELHGPYHYHYWRDEQGRHKRYVRQSQVAAIQAACAAYRIKQAVARERLKQTRTEWRKLKAMLKELEG